MGFWRGYVVSAPFCRTLRKSGGRCFSQGLGKVGKVGLVGLSYMISSIRRQKVVQNATKPTLPTLCTPLLKLRPPGSNIDVAPQKDEKLTKKNKNKCGY